MQYLDRTKCSIPVKYDLKKKKIEFKNIHTWVLSITWWQLGQAQVGLLSDITFAVVPDAPFIAAASVLWSTNHDGLHIQEKILHHITTQTIWQSRDPKKSERVRGCNGASSRLGPLVWMIWWVQEQWTCWRLQWRQTKSLNLAVRAGSQWRRNFNHI